MSGYKSHCHCRVDFITDTLLSDTTERTRFLYTVASDLAVPFEKRGKTAMQQCLFLYFNHVTKQYYHRKTKVTTEMQ